jgi:hypothetical protein
MEMYVMRKLEQKQQGDKRVKQIRINHKRVRTIMNDIEQIAEHMVGTTIEECQITYGEDTITIFLSSGASIEIIVDSIYADIPDFDD